MQIFGVWMVAWLEHAECQLQAVDQVFFAVLACADLIHPQVFPKRDGCIIVLRLIETC